MAQDNQHSDSAFALQAHGSGRRETADDSQPCSSDINKYEYAFVTHIHATDIAWCLRRLLAGFCIIVEIEGRTTRTSNKPILAGEDAMKLNKEILLPLSRSSVVFVRVCAPFVLGPRLGNGELICQLNISVGGVFDRNEQLQSIKFLVQRDDIGTSCSSLRIFAERRVCNMNNLPINSDPTLPNAMDGLQELSDVGKRALARYPQWQSQPDLDGAIACFARVRELCPIDYLRCSIVLFNLANAKFIDYQVNYRYPDLEMSIALYRDTLRLRTESHPAHCTTALYLSFALLVRFQLRRNETDMMQATELLTRVVDSSPVESHAYRAGHFALQMTRVSAPIAVDAGISQMDPEDSIQRSRDMLSPRNPGRPALLAALGKSVLLRFQRNRDIHDIHEAIAMLEHAVQLASDNNLDKPEWLNELGRSLMARFELLDDLVDLTNSISAFGEAHNLTPIHHLTKLALLTNLGHTLSVRFKRLGDLVDINESISAFSEAFDLTPNDHPTKPALLNKLGYSLSARFDHLGDLADINMSIYVFNEALHSIPSDHLAKPSLLTNLGRSLFCRFHRLADLDDIDNAISVYEKVICITPDGHPDKLNHLNDLGILSLARFEHTGDLLNIHKAISIQQEAVGLTHDDHPRKPALLMNLGIWLARRFQCLCDLVDINGSISMLDAALCLTPDNHPDKPGRLGNLGTSLIRRFDYTNDLGDIDKSILVNEEAVRLTPDGSPDKPRWLCHLASSLFRRFKHLGHLADIQKVIEVEEEALRLTPDRHPGKPVLISNLGSSLVVRFQRIGDLVDLDRSISMLEQTIHLVPDEDRPNWLKNLGSSLSCRFEHLGNLADINKAISVKEEAVSLTPDGHPQKPSLLQNLAIAFQYRFERLAQPGDIDMSISMLEDAVRLTSDGCLDKPGLLNSLGISLRRRFEHLRDLADIDRSILMSEKGVRLIPHDHPTKPILLNTLGNSLHRRFTRLSNIPDIEKAISMGEEALRLTTDNHFNKPVLLDSLGCAFLSRFNHTRDPSSVSTAISYLSASSRTSTGSISIRFQAAHHWITSARLQGNSQSLLDACATAISLLPQLAWVGLPLTERHRVLVDAARVTRDAAAAAIEAGYPELAVEWLEQGRSIVWNQLLQLRTPVDELRVEYPALADQFRQISQQLERAGSQDGIIFKHTSSDLIADTRSSEQDVQKHHDLAFMRDKLLGKIRSLSGFEQFLLPKTIEQLVPLANTGPVVYLTASRERCDALIVKAETESVIPVPLLGVHYQYVEVLQRLFRFLLEQKYLVIPRDAISALVPPEAKASSRQLLDMLSGRDGINHDGIDRAVKTKQRVMGLTPDELFQAILGYLWNEVVQPVLQALGFSTPPSDPANMVRIFWCPTGPFSFLPIHAAGVYSAPEAGSKLSDFAISSYVPSLSSLTPSLQKDLDPNDPPPNVRLVVIPQSSTDGLSRLYSVEDEIDYIRGLSDRSPFVTLQHSDCTVEDVMAKLTNSDWAHFACHGVQDSKNPLDSGLCLSKRRRLTLSDIIRLSRPQGGLAFLSACQTAQGDETLPEESVHLAAGMLLAGYGGVIATMWAIRDDDAPKVTRDVYEHLFRDGKVPDSTEAAEALHYAVQCLRDSGAPLTSWAPFIHVGK